MTEQDWQTESRWLGDVDLEPRRILNVLEKGRASERKLRLFATACAREAWDLYPETDRLALAVAEEYAAGIASESDRVAALLSLVAREGGRPVPMPEGELRAYDLGPGGLTFHALFPIILLLGDREYILSGATGPSPLMGLDPSLPHVAFKRASLISAHTARLLARRLKTSGLGRKVHQFLSVIVGGLMDGDWSGDRGIEGWYFKQPHARQRDLLRDIFGNPFRPVAVDPSWLTSTVRGLAEGIYADRAFDRMPILADALEESGCDGPDILTHCRGDGPHVRGCWVVDLILGKG